MNRLLLCSAIGVFISGSAFATNKFYGRIGEYKVVDRDCMWENADGSCGDNYGSVTEVKITGDSDQAQIYSMTYPGKWSPYSDFPLREGKWTDVDGSRTSSWYEDGAVVGNRNVFDTAFGTYSATISLEPTARGLKLKMSVGNPGTEKPDGILYISPK